MRLEDRLGMSTREASFRHGAISKGFRRGRSSLGRAACVYAMTSILFALFLNLYYGVTRKVSHLGMNMTPESPGFDRISSRCRVSDTIHLM